ncbi:MAG TPA: hypothetical protein VK673_02840 [Chthoniobacterales bacterium]|nr:hypothetical protein [Chthoniobacterales bacterium]
MASILWTDFQEELLSPERRNDSSLVRPRPGQECVQDKARPVGNGLSWSTGAFTLKVVEGPFRPNHTVPYGTVPFLDAFQP